MTSQIYLDLPCGTKMPIVGLGTCQPATQTEDDMKETLEAAVENGYHLMDTAYVYRNEHVIGKALGELIKSGKLKREDIFVSTKLPGNHLQSRDKIRKCFETSLTKLGLDYLDLYMIHWPMAVKENDDDFIFPIGEDGKLASDTVDLVEVWKHLEELVDEGKIKALGLSNFNSKQIQRIYEQARHPISNLQVECHAYLAQNELFEFCKERKISMTSFASLGSPDRPDGFTSDTVVSQLLFNKVVVNLAKKYNRSVPQILLRNLIQRGIAVIPKSRNPKRIKENIQVFDFTLSHEDMAAIAKLNCNARCFGLDVINGAKDHPEFPFTIPF